MTTVTDVIVFGIGFFSTTEALSIFGWVTSIGVLMDYVIQVHFVVPVMQWDMIRREKGKQMLGDCRRGTARALSCGNKQSRVMVHSLNEEEDTAIEHTSTAGQSMPVRVVDVKEPGPGIASPKSSVVTNMPKDVQDGYEMEEDTGLTKFFGGPFADFVESKAGKGEKECWSKKQF
eukprot:TRINITY_DN13435_c0_g1_i1.p1 TRINITY_DN13435_c0_g1~~TRINITY_DN13435_c0_g1_i1.p1  ORF type:complete len:183 (-),score=63.09 TRINITY_DN13435_c0_g1_i1:323-847(-)